MLLLGVGHVVPALHFLFVAHHLCAEHGELVDAVAEPGRGESAEKLRGEPASADKAGADKVGADKAGADKAASLAAVCVSGAAAHAHEHCEMFTATRAAAALAPAPSCAQVLPAVELVSPAGEARDAHVDIALLHYAPKLAPPVRAALA